MARAQLALGNPGAAKLLAVRAAKADPADPAPLLVQAEIARSAREPAAELAAAEAAAEIDPDSPHALLALGRALFERGRFREANEALTQAVALAPRSPDPHLALALLRLDGDGNAQAALAEAKLFLTLCIQPPPPGHPIHALVQRCEEALKPTPQASVVQSQ
jgi:tetratricopeptide (TPR) repeat protein